VIKATATELGLQGYMTDTKREGNAGGHNNYGRCVVLARDAERLTPFIEKGWIAFGNDDKLPRTAPWSDDYVNVLFPLAETITKKLSAAIQRKVDKLKK
jgi:hypothetical protein